MNNGMFALTRHLRDRGIDADLLFTLPLGHEHFHPKADTFDLRDLAFCYEVCWLDGGFYRADPGAIRRDMRGYDMVLANGAEAAVLSLAEVPIDIYFPYGDDLVTYAGLPPAFTGSQLARQQLRVLLKRSDLTVGRLRKGTQFGHVRRAICTAQNVIVDWANAEWDDALGALPLAGRIHRSAWPFIYAGPYREQREDRGWGDVHWRSATDRLRTERDLVVLYHGRHEWTRGDVQGKHTDHLLLGFAEFVRTHRDVNACLATVEYGRDVRASKDLIAELGLAERVVWFPLMYRKDVMSLASNADLCCGEFDRSWLTGGTIVEALSLGKPLIHHREDSLYSEVPLYPVLNAREPAEIAAAIARYVEDPDGWCDRGLEGQAWFDEYVVRRPLDLICDLLGQGDPQQRSALSQARSGITVSTVSRARSVSQAGGPPDVGR
jgi:glycosyltransferase involved in cell wall biosynthesis